MRKCFTGEELAKAHLLDLTSKERSEKIRSDKTKTKVHSSGYLARLRCKIWPDKIFLIRFQDGRGVIIEANNENDACVDVVPSLIEYRKHHCENPTYNRSCKDCREYFDHLATRLNEARIVWLGWGQPDFNWVIHF